MAFSITDEMFIFLYSCLTGAEILHVYDIVSLARRQQACSMFFNNICDGIFVLVACALMVFVLFSVTNGIVRGFEFAGAVLGGLIYKLLFSPFISKILEKILLLSTAFFKIFFKILLTPLGFLYKMINRCIVFLFMPITKAIKKCAVRISRRFSTWAHITRKVLEKS